MPSNISRKLQERNFKKSRDKGEKGQYTWEAHLDGDCRWEELIWSTGNCNSSCKSQKRLKSYVDKYWKEDNELKTMKTFKALNIFNKIFTWNFPISVIILSHPRGGNVSGFRKIIPKKTKNIVLRTLSNHYVDCHIFIDWFHLFFFQTFMGYNWQIKVEYIKNTAWWSDKWSHHEIIQIKSFTLLIILWWV